MSEDRRLVGEGAVFMATREGSPLRVAHVDAAYLRVLMDDIERDGVAAMERFNDSVDALCVSFKAAGGTVQGFTEFLAAVTAPTPKKPSHLAAKGGRKKNRGRKRGWRKG